MYQSTLPRQEMFTVSDQARNNLITFLYSSIEKSTLKKQGAFFVFVCYTVSKLDYSNMIHTCCTVG